MYVYGWLCMHECMRVYIPVCVHICMHVCVRCILYVCVNVCMYVRMPVCVYSCVHPSCMCHCVYAWAVVCMPAFMYVWRFTLTVHVCIMCGYACVPAYRCREVGRYVIVHCRAVDCVCVCMYVLSDLGVWGIYKFRHTHVCHIIHIQPCNHTHITTTH